MNIVTVIATLIDNIRRRHRYHRTERLLGAMPTEVLKDIGWPGAREGLDVRMSRRQLR